MNFLQTLVIQPLEDCYHRFLTFIPGLLTSMVLFVAGIIAGAVLA